MRQHNGKQRAIKPRNAKSRDTSCYASAEARDMVGSFHLRSLRRIIKGSTSTLQQEGGRQLCLHEQTILSSFNAVLHSRRHALLLWDLVILFTSTLHTRAL